MGPTAAALPRQAAEIAAVPLNPETSAVCRDWMVELRGFELIAIAACSRLSAVLQSMRIGPSSLSVTSTRKPSTLWRLPLPPRRQLMEAVPGLDEDRGLAAGRLVEANDHIDIERIELNAAADAARVLRRD